MAHYLARCLRIPQQRAVRAKVLRRRLRETSGKRAQRAFDELQMLVILMRVKQQPAGEELKQHAAD